MKNIAIILFLSIILVVLTLFGRAQAISGDFFIEVSPEIPGPNKQVFAKVMSYSFDVNRSYITWFVNGVSKLQGRGEKNFSFSTEDIGKQTSLSVSITTETGLHISKTMYFSPSEVDLLWQAQTHTPASYKGKAMPGSESLVKVTAIPHFGKGIKWNSPNLIYNWKLDYKNKPDSSGIKENSFTFKTEGPFNESVVSVEVMDYNRTVVAKNSARIKNQNPKLIFYKDHPLEGPDYASALTDELTLEQAEIFVRAEPYFFSNSALKRLSYEWRMNNKKIEPEENPNLMNFRIEPGSRGSAEISLRISNPINILQFAESALRINF